MRAVMKVYVVTTKSCDDGCREATTLWSTRADAEAEVERALVQCMATFQWDREKASKRDHGKVEEMEMDLGETAPPLPSSRAGQY